MKTKFKKLQDAFDEAFDIPISVPQMTPEQIQDALVEVFGQPTSVPQMTPQQIQNLLSYMYGDSKQVYVVRVTGDELAPLDFDPNSEEVIY